MLSRRRLLHTGCAVCAALALGLRRKAFASEEINGAAYKLWFVGGMSETIMMGKREAALDLRTLKGRPHVYGVGPLEGLTGEATIADSRPSLARVDAAGRVLVEESYAAGVPFFVWAEVDAWTEVPIPGEIKTYSELESFVEDAGKEASLTQAFPFVVIGTPNLIDYHIVNATPETPVGMAAHDKIRISFDLHDRAATIVGFWSDKHPGIFTPRGSNTHIHFQTAENDCSGHVQGLVLGEGSIKLRLPH